MQRPKPKERLKIPDLSMCNHHGPFRKVLSQPRSEKLCEIFHQSRNSYCIEEGEQVLHTCRRCQTEFQCEIREMDDGSFAIAIIVWQGLGMGRTPLDQIWLSRFQNLTHYDDIHYDMGSLQSAFEDPA